MRFLFLLFLSPLIAICQKDLDKWQNAVINIEGQHTKLSLNQINDSLFRARKEGKLNNERDEMDMLRRLISQKKTLSGSAVYVKFNNKEYLISAKHVFVDPTISNYLIQNVSIRTPLELFVSGRINDYVINTSKLVSIASDTLDLCIISLQGEQANGLRNLLKNDGYVPVSIDEKDLSREYKTADDIVAIGYPEISSVQRMKRWNNLQASDIVVPVTTFGKISMFHQRLPFFYGDITVYPGNSGGPVISNGKLVGIVSQQIKIPTSVLDSNSAEVNIDIYSRGALAIIVKASHLIQLLNDLQQKE